MMGFHKNNRFTQTERRSNRPYKMKFKNKFWKDYLLLNSLHQLCGGYLYYVMLSGLPLIPISAQKEGIRLSSSLQLSTAYNEKGCISTQIISVHL